MHARHIELAFRLQSENHLPRNPTLDEFEILFSLFPACLGVAVLGPFLVIHVEKIPPKPWPVSVAGLPLFLTTNGLEVPWTLGGAGNMRYAVLEHLDARNGGERALYDAVIAFFEEQSIEISELVWFFGCWRVRLAAERDVTSLPGKVCQTTTFYTSEELASPQMAYRQTTPVKWCPDDTEYSTIRPGVMVASSHFLTTSGIFVRGPTSEIYMTVASHGFPDGDSHVHHPQADGLILGKVIHRIEDTDIALAKVEENIVFENRTFQNQVEPGGVFLRGIKDPFQLKYFDMISMDNPYTGLIDGQFLTVGLKRAPSGVPTKKLWVEQLWQWYGQDTSATPLEGCCGSALWDMDGSVICFFQYINTDNIGIGIAAQELVYNGYTLYD